jgi:hypothetical protein
LKLRVDWQRKNVPRKIWENRIGWGFHDLGNGRSSIEVLGPGSEVEADRPEDLVMRLSISVATILKNVVISV